MKEFMLLIRNEINHQDGWNDEKQHSFLKACEKYIDNLTNDGKLKSAQPLIREGKMISGSTRAWKIDPFNASNEIIVGYYHIFAKDIDEAISIGKANPEFEYGTTARIEVRPIKTKESSTGYSYPAHNKQGKKKPGKSN